MTKNGAVVPLLDSLNGDREKSEELEIFHLDSEVLHATPKRFVFSLIETADVHIENLTKSKALQALTFYRFGAWLLQKPYELFHGFNNSLNPCFFSS